VGFFVARPEGFEPERAARNRKGRKRFSRAGPQTATRSRTADAQQMQNPSGRGLRLGTVSIINLQYEIYHHNRGKEKMNQIEFEIVAFYT
jgi:hypothetical protein